MILLIDNYDSFVYNLSRYVRELGHESQVRRHDAVSPREIRALDPSHIIISPGPCTPTEAGVSTDVVRACGASVPILGVCLGHQCIGVAYGGRVIRARRPMHGKTSRVTHTGDGLFQGLPNPLIATRYHSLVLERESLPDDLIVTATAEDGEIMAIRHRTHPTIGLQFHPESVLTHHGYALLARFLGADPRASLPAAADTLLSEPATGP